MTDNLRRRLRHGHAYAVLMASAALAALVPAAHALTSGTSPDAETVEYQDIVVIGSGQTRSVATLLTASLDALPPGASLQKALDYLPGVSAQSIDALGVNEQSLSLQVRGFSTTHLGYTLDGMPLAMVPIIITTV